MGDYVYNGLARAKESGDLFLAAGWFLRIE